MDTEADELVICNDRDGQLQNCRRNTGAFDGVPALSKPIGLHVSGDKVWISERDTARVRVCDWYSRSLTHCSQPSTVPGMLGLAGQVVVNGDRTKAYLALEADDAVAVCRNASSMTDWEMAEVTRAPSQMGMRLAFDNLWIGNANGVTRCPLTGGAIDNSTCVSTPLVGGGNGVFIDGSTLYLAQTDASSIMVCTIGAAPGLAVDSCRRDVTFANGPGFAGLDVFGGRLFTPLSIIDRPFISVCSASVQGCGLGSWPLNNVRATTGTTNIAHAPAPVVE